MNDCSESARSEYYRAILDAVEQPLIVTGASGVIAEFNAAAERLTGYAAAEVLGRVRLTSLYDGAPALARAASDQPGAAQAAASGAFAEAGTGAPPEREWTLVRKDGARIRVSVAWRVLRAASGAVIARVVLPRELSRRATHERLGEDAQPASAPPAVVSEAVVPEVIALQAVMPLPIVSSGPVDTSAERDHCFAPADVLRRLGGDEALFTEIAELFQRERAALGADIWRAVESRDPGALERGAHRLRSALLNLAAGPAARAAFSLEDCGRRGRLPEPEQLAALYAELDRLSAALSSSHGAPPCTC